MTGKTFVAAACLAILGLGATAQAEIPFSDANRETIEVHILPGYAALASASADLAKTAQDYCIEGEGDPAALRDAYGKAMAAWQSIQHIRFGPIAEEDRHYRLEFWPDKRNKTDKALASLKREIADGKVVDAARIAQTSVAAQGFPALERLLFDDDHPLTRGEANCQLSVAITGNVASIGKAVDEAWTTGGFADAALGGEGYYQKPKDLAFELFKTLQTVLQWVEDSKLRRPMGDDLDSARGQRAESWRSRQSLAHILNNIEAARAFYTANGAGGFARLLQGSTTGADLHWGIMGKLREIQEELDGIEQPLFLAVTDQTSRAALDRAVAELRELRRWVDQEMAANLEMPLGFNSLDGD